MRHLIKYKVHNDEQHGFRRGRSCEAQIDLSAIDPAKALDRQSLDYVAMMNFSKAFDLVPHQRLPLELRHFWIKGKLHNWIQYFFTM